MRLERVPVTYRQARRFVAEHHRHNLSPQGWLFGVGVARPDGELVGVGIAGRPVAHLLQDGRTFEVTRVCVLEGYPNGCSVLYGALARAGAALGYRRVVTYTLATEPGTSLRAAGWEPDGVVEARRSWDRPKRPRVQTDLFGEARRPAGAKVRWSRALAADRGLAPR